jgi:predicted secreted protein with PEFG-CTERM motif
VINSKHTLTILASLMLVAGMPLAFADGHASDGLTITADAVEGSTTITITGHATSGNTPVTIMVLAPNGNVVSIDQINPDSDGSFTSTIGVGGPMWKQDGVYSITAQQGSASMNKSTVEVEVADGAVVPEFGTIASLVLVVAISSIVVLSAKGRLSFTPRI